MHPHGFSLITYVILKKTDEVMCSKKDHGYEWLVLVYPFQLRESDVSNI